MRYISSNSFEDIFNGVSLLIESFANTNNLDEQFELIKYLPDIIDLMIKKENKKDVKEIYYQAWEQKLVLVYLINMVEIHFDLYDLKWNLIDLQYKFLINFILILVLTEILNKYYRPAGLAHSCKDSSPKYYMLKLLMFLYFF